MAQTMKINPRESYPFKIEVATSPALTGGEMITYADPEEDGLLLELQKRNDFEAQRLQRLLALPDLTRTKNSPVKLVIDKILTVPDLRGFDVVSIPETISPANNFDLFDFPADHPTRRETDSYFLTPGRMLRTQTTSMWMYHLKNPATIKKLESRGFMGLLSYGKVYRKDEIDRKHFSVFHQIDGLYLVKKSQKVLTLEDLQNVLTSIVGAVFGAKAVTRFLPDAFPYTDPSTQMEVKFGDDWLEILGAGMARGSTLAKLGIDPAIYGGGAFGFGVERLAMQKMQIPDIRILWSTDPRITAQFTNIESVYTQVSRYPEIIRDISFIVPKAVVPNRFYEVVRELGGNLVEEVKLIDEYENEAKLGVGNKSYTFRTIYRSFERTLTNEEVGKIHAAVEEFLRKELGAVIR